MSSVLLLRNTCEGVLCRNIFQMVLLSEAILKREEVLLHKEPSLSCHGSGLVQVCKQIFN